jgi:intracellular sulfur oxidation DsrE/DsrF family protein
MRYVMTFAALLLVAAPLSAQRAVRAGPVIQSAGAVFEVPDPGFPTPTDLDYRVAFEIRNASSQPDRLNMSLNTVARFLNMHAQAGVPRDRIHAAVVVHGTAGWELLDNEAYRERNGVDNPNAELIRELAEAGTQIILCGQSAASRRIPTDHLLDGVELALSAMTAFVVLQQEGYRVNPW